MGEKNKITAKSKEETLNKHLFTNNLHDCLGDVIIEAIIEKPEAKIALFNQLAEINHSETVFASNTSSLSITQIAKGVKNPERVIGMHFFNPATIMKLVEVVKTELTNEQTINQYFTGLHINIRTELEKYRAMIRNAGIGNGPAPSWDFRSVSQLIQRAMACDTELSRVRQPTRHVDTSAIPVHLRSSSSLARPQHPLHKARTNVKLPLRLLIQVLTLRLNILVYIVVSIHNPLPIPPRIVAVVNKYIKNNNQLNHKNLLLRRRQLHLQPVRENENDNKMYLKSHVLNAERKVTMRRIVALLLVHLEPLLLMLVNRLR